MKDNQRRKEKERMDNDRLINLTGQTIRIVGKDLSGDWIMMHSIAPIEDMPAAWVRERVADVGNIDGVPAVAVIGLDVDCLPDHEPGDYLIVTPEVKAALPYRPDLLTPWGPIYEEDGTLIGYTSLLR